MVEILCRVKSCNCEFELDRHHIVPKFTFPLEYDKGKKWDIFQGECNKMFLCKKHHNTIHLLISRLIWNNRHLSDLELQKRIWNYTEWFVNNWVR